MTPPGPRRGRPRINHHERAAWCRGRKGEWVYVQTYPAMYVARSMASTVRGGRSNAKITAYKPDGTFDAKLEEAEEGWELWVKYLGELEEEEEEES